ncbi:MAG: DEP domain-containing protein [Cyanobacteria bacterium J06621_8]
MDTFQQQSPSAYLILKHSLSVQKSNSIIDRWLTDHPQESRQSLAKLLNLSKVIFKNERLCDLPKLSADDAKLLMKEIQSSSTLEVKDRRYRLTTYPQCFVGKELVQWLIENKELLTAEAIAWGQSLIDHNLIEHVCQDHEFENKELFYHFC